MVNSIIYNDEKYNLDNLFNNKIRTDQTLDNYLSNFDKEEIEVIISIAEQYKDIVEKYKENKNGCYPIMNYFCAIRFILNMQSGMNKKDAYLDSHHHLDIVKKYQTSKRKDVEYRINCLVSAFLNNKIFKELTIAMDTPIQASYQGYKHQALEVLIEVAKQGKSERERVNASKALLEILDKKDDNINININQKKVSIINTSLDRLEQLSREKRKILEMEYEVNK